MISRIHHSFFKSIRARLLILSGMFVLLGSLILGSVVYLVVSSQIVRRTETVDLPNFVRSKADLSANASRAPWNHPLPFRTTLRFSNGSAAGKRTLSRAGSRQRR